MLSNIIMPAIRVPAVFYFLQLSIVSNKSNKERETTMDIN